VEVLTCGLVRALLVLALEGLVLESLVLMLEFCVDGLVLRVEDLVHYVVLVARMAWVAWVARVLYVIGVLGVFSEFGVFGMFREFRELGVFGMLGEFDLLAFDVAIAFAFALAFGLGPLAGVLSRWILVGHRAHCDRLPGSCDASSRSTVAASTRIDRRK
jgi:hypothetical protein